MNATNLIGTLLEVPYSEKEQAKALGARWASDLKKWYVPAGEDLGPFARWLPGSPGSAASEIKTALVQSPPSLQMLASAALYVGQKAGAEVWGCLGQARHSVSVVSPFLAPGHVNLLAQLSARGVDVTLVTTEKLFESEAFGAIGENLVWQEPHANEDARRRRQRGMRYSLLAALAFCVVALLGAVLGRYVLILALLGVPVSVVAFRYFRAIATYSYSYHSRLARLKVIVGSPRGSHQGAGETPLVHAKLYVIDGEVAYLGSLNFTGSGFFRHFETCVRIDEPAAVESLRRLVMALYEEAEWQSMGHDGIAGEMIRRGLFREPAN